MICEKEGIFFRNGLGVPFPRIGDIMKDIELYGAPYDIKIKIGNHLKKVGKETLLN